MLMHRTTHSGNDCSPETLVVKFLFLYLRLYNMAARVRWREKKEEIYHDHTPAANKKEPEKKT